MGSAYIYLFRSTYSPTVGSLYKRLVRCIYFSTPHALSLTLHSAPTPSIDRGSYILRLAEVTANEQTCHLHNMTRDEIRITLSNDETDKDPSNKPLIQMVPHILRSRYSKEDCERYFEPTSVMIGPLNHQRAIDEDLRINRVEECKLKLAAVFIQNSGGTTKDFFENVKKEINSLKNCYNSKEVEKWTDEDLAWMFLVDGCALLGFIVLDVQDLLKDFSVDNDLVSIEKTDFFLLENQLPYQLLETLINRFAQLSDGTSRETKLKELCDKFITKFINGISLSPTAQQEQKREELCDKFITKFINGISFSPTAQQEQQREVPMALHPHEQQQEEEHPHEQQEEEEEHPHEQQQEEEHPPHLLDLLRKRLTGVKSKEKVKREKRSYNLWPSIRNVKELKQKGIHFKAREKGDAITDIDFNEHGFVPTLTLTPIFLHNTTMPLLLNLMAYELCPGFKEDCKIISYLSFLDYLIDNGEDVKDLSDAGVLHNGLGSDEAVAELFNKISSILVSNLKIDSELKRNIHEYCNNKSYFSSLRDSIRAKLTYIYFRSPWSFLVFIAALAGLVMTGTQTYKSFY